MGCIGDAFTHKIALAIEKALKVGMARCIRLSSPLGLLYLLYALFVRWMGDIKSLGAKVLCMISSSLKVRHVQNGSMFMVAALYVQKDFMVTIHQRSSS